MDENLNMLPSGGSYGGLDMQGSIRFNQQQPHSLLHQHHQRQGPSLHPSINDVFPPLRIGTMQDCDHHPISMVVDYSTKGNDGANKIMHSDDDEPSLTEEPVDCHNDSGKGKKGSPWQRVKWTDKMVKLLITAVSYVGEDNASDCGGGRRKYALLQKKGKWKSVSKVMAERGFFVSPQQCEDKFNDLNKRYKRLNDVLGRGTSCQVVENPALLDVMDHLSEKVKDDVRKILSSKHLFYEEMCSYHNGNRLHLPPDPALQRALQLALRSGEDNEKNDMKRHSHDDHDEDEHDGETDEHDEFEETHTIQGGSYKRMKQSQGSEEFSFKNAINPHEVAHVDMNQMFAEGSKASWMQNQWLRSRSIQLEEQKIELEMEMLELEKQRLKWQKFSKKKDRELEKMRMENERMKLENEQMTLELKRKGINIDFN